VKQTAEEIEAITGTARREALIASFADRLVLGWAMTLEQARRHAEQCWPSVEIVAAPGQVWWKATPPHPGDLGALFGDPSEELTIVDIDRWSRMVDVGGGQHVNLEAYLEPNFVLAAWPEEFQPGADVPQPPAASLTPVEEEGDDDEDDLDPREMVVLISREADWKQKTAPSDIVAHLPMLSDHWSSTPYNTKRPELGYIAAVDVIAYLQANLANYREGWPDFTEQWRNEDAWEAFNELSWEGFETDTPVAAYLGDWLWKAIAGDVVREHGGRIDDYQITFMWGGPDADTVIEAYPYADPRAELPVDHPLRQFPGQLDLLGELGGDAA
jgi:hypothetical protein